jgi:CRP-like cAMP-binding protein
MPMVESHPSKTQTDLTMTDAPILSFTRGDTIFAQGETGEHAYLLLTGQVSLHQYLDGSSIDLGTLCPGDIIGEMAVMGESRRMATVIALEDCTVQAISATAFESRLATGDGVLAAMLRLFIKNIGTCRHFFLRRPRSLHDHLLLMGSCATNIRRFAMRPERRDETGAFLAALSRLEEALRELNRLAPHFPDRRNDMLSENHGDRGVGLDQVIRSDGHR